MPSVWALSVSSVTLYCGTVLRKMLFTSANSGCFCVSAITAFETSAKLRSVAARAVFQHELETSRSAQSQNGRQAEAEDNGLRDREELLLRAPQDRCELQVFRLALFPGLERRNYRRDIGIVSARSG